MGELKQGRVREGKGEGEGREGERGSTLYLSITAHLKNMLIVSFTRVKLILTSLEYDG